MNIQDWAHFNEMRRRFLTKGANGVSVPVGNGASSQAVTFALAEPDANYGVVVMPSWATTMYVGVADKLRNGFTVHFGTAAGAMDTIDYIVFRG